MSHSHPLDRALARYIKRAYACAPAIQKIFDTAQIKPSGIKRVADLEQVPVTSKDQFVQLQQQDPPFGGFLAVDPKHVKRIFQSPGPIYEPRGTDKTQDRTAAKIFRRAGFRRGDVVLNTLSYHLSPGGWILDGGLQTLGATVVPGGVGNTELQIQLLRDLKITGYAGAPSFLMTIFKKAEEQKIRAQDTFALRHALFTAEPYPPSLRAAFENEYGLKTMNAYATAELGFLAHDCAAQAGLHMVEDVIIQICDPGTGKPVVSGETGQVVVTALNESYPLVRFGTGDLATFLDAPCACRHNTPRLALVGRVGDAVKVRGMFVHPNQLKSALAKFPAIARTQGIISRRAERDHFLLKVELAQKVSNRDELSREIQTATQELCRVKIDAVEFLPLGSIAADAKPLLDERQWR